MMFLQSATEVAHSEGNFLFLRLAAVFLLEFFGWSMSL